MWDNSSGHKGQGDCICTLVVITVNRVEGRGWEVTLHFDPLGQPGITTSLLVTGGGERNGGGKEWESSRWVGTTLKVGSVKEMQ